MARSRGRDLRAGARPVAREPHDPGQLQVQSTAPAPGRGIETHFAPQTAPQAAFQPALADSAAGEALSRCCLAVAADAITSTAFVKGSEINIVNAPTVTA